MTGSAAAGLSPADRRAYLQHVADRRLAQLGIEPLNGSANPLAFIDLQDVQGLSSFFERRVFACQVGVTGNVSFDDDFWRPASAGRSPPRRPGQSRGRAPILGSCAWFRCCPRPRRSCTHSAWAKI